MTVSQANEVFRAALSVGLKAVLPILAAAVIVGLIVAVFQAATQIHEQSLSFVPKLIAVALVVALLGPFILESLMDFVRHVFELAVHLD